MLADILAGYANVFQLNHLTIVVLGTLIGVALGAFPELDCTVGVALFLPVTYAMTPAQAILLLSALYSGAVYGAQIPAILFRVPGAPEAVVTTLDGYPMAGKRGRPERHWEPGFCLPWRAACSGSWG